MAVCDSGKDRKCQDRSAHRAVTVAAAVSGCVSEGSSWGPQKVDEKVRQEFTPRPTAQAPGDGDAEQSMEGAARKTRPRATWPELAAGRGGGTPGVSGLRGESSWRGGRSVQGTARHQGRRLRGLRGLRGPRAECQMRGSQGEQGQNTGAGTGPREPAFRGGDEGAGVEETARQWTRATTWRGGHPFPQEEGAAEPAPAGPDARPRSFGKHSGFRFF